MLHLLLTLLLPLVQGPDLALEAPTGFPTELQPQILPVHQTTLQFSSAPVEETLPHFLGRSLGGEFRLLQDLPPSRLAPERLLFESQLDGYPVAGHQVRVFFLRDGSLQCLVDRSQPFSWSGAAVLEEDQAKRMAREQFPAGLAIQSSSCRLEILPLLGGARLCYRVDLLSEGSSSFAWRLWIDAETGHCWARLNRCLHQTGQAMVFLPNPVQDLDDSSLSDQNDSGTAVPAAAYHHVALPLLNGNGYLDGTWATTDATPGRSFRSNLDFRHNRQGPIFEEANAYYHVTEFQLRMQSLGIHARRSQQRINVVDTFFGIPYANASYNSNSGVIAFGTAGVDFAEDADVVVHEYGHAIHDDVQGGLSGGFGGSENGAMGEGYGDWLAAIHSDDALVGEWVDLGHGWNGQGFPATRRVDGIKHYPEDKVGQVHSDGEIWSGALWEIARMLGNDDALVLVIEAMALMSPQTGMQAAAQSLLTAETQLWGGSKRAYVAGPLMRTGLVSPPSGTPLLEASRRALRAGDGLSFQLTSSTHAFQDYQVVVSRAALPSALGAPFHTQLDIGSELLAWSLANPVLQGQLDTLGQAQFSLTVPPGLAWKTDFFAQAMILDGAGAATALSAPIAFRTERH